MGRERQGVEEKLDEVIRILRHLLVLELARQGVSQQLIGKHVRTAKAAVGEMLRGIERE